MEHVKKIIVAIQFEDKEIDLGELVSEGHSIYFKYYKDFIDRNIEISPIKLKLNDQIHRADRTPFDGLYGVFADSLPDGWGKLLLDRALIAKGIDVSEISPLDRLAYVGKKGLGALTYRPEKVNESGTNFGIELDEIATASNIVLSGQVSERLDELYNLAGSSGGARPKILVGCNVKSKHLIASDNLLPDGYEHWIIKFPSSFDRLDISTIEFAYYKMALDSGIEMSESELFTGLSGKTYFGTKRFDRHGNDRLHLHSAAGMMHDNFRLSNLDYGNLMECAFRLERNVDAYEKILRLAAFNVFVNNRDDHSKNFSFLMDSNGNWKVAPAYDLTFSSSGHGMHSTLVAGESANPTKKHLLELASYFKVKNALSIINQVQEVVSNWKKYADECGVSPESNKLIASTISRNLK